jgi:hypothetical protein
VGGVLGGVTSCDTKNVLHSNTSSITWNGGWRDMTEKKGKWLNRAGKEDTELSDVTLPVPQLVAAPGAAGTLKARQKKSQKGARRKHETISIKN